jgi:peptidoglycan/xylan/chitin deacetylase (PgdA/CDA1 family)
MAQIPILMYHAVEDHPGGNLPASERLYVLSRESFLAQMQYLAEHGFQTLLLTELDEEKTIPPKSIVLTFDDGHSSNYSIALPILRNFGFRAEFFITTAWIGEPDFLTIEQIKGLYVQGMAVGSHGHSHRFFDDLTDRELHQELLDSRAILESIISEKVQSVSAPGGRVSRMLSQLIRELNFSFLCTSRFGYMTPGMENQICPRMVIKNTTSLETFCRIVEQDNLYIRQQQRKYLLLSLLKKILGNSRYARWHNSVSDLFR